MWNDAGSGILASILRLFRTLRGKPIKKNPVKLYDIVQEVLMLILFMIWIKMSWKKQRGIEALLKNCYQYLPQNGSSNISRKVNVAKFFNRIIN
jgi:hypothetical protein